MTDSVVRVQMDQSPEHSRIRKDMRKGTQSCTECRRRKIRCTFAPDSPSLCRPCASRGSQCIDQRSASSRNGVDETKTLRDRVARLESLLEAALKDDKSDRSAQPEHNELLSRAPDTDESEEFADNIDGDIDSAPLLSVLNDAVGVEDVVLNHAQAHPPPSQYATTLSVPQISHGFNPNSRRSSGLTKNQQSRSKNARICETLRSSLPKYDSLLSILTKRGSWWEYWRQKTYGTTKSIESLPQYASRIFTSGSPTELGLLVSAFGLTTETNGPHYLALVDKLIISDNDYAATLGGLECIVLQGKCYLDVGQPRRAWLAYRRGLTLSQLMNLHHKHGSSLESDSVWWALYQGDRFISLILGLPYSINDAHCDLSPHNSIDGLGLAIQPFTLQCGVIAGKIIDRNQSAAQKSISKAMEIDDEMQNLAATLPQSWWDISSILTDSLSRVPEIRQRILLQVFFFLIRTYLHLPFLLNAQQNLGFSYQHSRMACIDSARMMVQRYHMLRSEFRGQALYDCKTNDFVGFIASIVLLIGNSRNDTAIGEPSVEDENLIEASLNIFKRLSECQPCKLFSQCHIALKILIGKQEQDESLSSTKVFIPYFGTISVKQTPKNSLFSYPSIQNQTSPSHLSMGFNAEMTNWFEFEVATMQQSELPLSNSTSVFSPSYFGSGGDSWQSFSDDGDACTWLDDYVPMLDIDQDWSWMDVSSEG